MKINTTPHADPELEALRLRSRRLYGIGLTLCLLGAGLFIVSAFNTIPAH